jgi:hypothetical protein
MRARGVILAALVVLAAGCAAQRSPAPPSLPTSMPSEEEARRVQPGAGEAIPRPAGAVFRVQLLATADRALAERRAAEYGAELGAPVRIDTEGALFKVRVGECARREEAEALQARARARGHAEAFVVESDGSER